MPFKPNEREYRSVGGISFEESSGGVLIVRGTPVVFDKTTCLFEDENGTKYYERIDRAAFASCDMRDFIFNHNHGTNDPTVYARTRNGTLSYTITDTGLECEMRLNNEDERHRSLWRDIRSGLIDGMSFSFLTEINGDEYDINTHTRTVRRIKKLFDVSAVDFPAYDDTSISARSASGFFSVEHAKELAALEQAAERRQRLIALTHI